MPVFENTLLRCRISDLAEVRYLGLREQEHNLCVPGNSLAAIRLAGREYPATFARATPDGGLRLGFGDSGVTAELTVSLCPRHLVLEVRNVSNPAVDELVFLDIPLQAAAMEEHGLAACALALNARTKVEGFPGDQDHLRAFAFRALNVIGARVAIMVCPRSELRALLQAVVREAPELPHSPMGGPWALDHPVNRGSYIFDRGVTESNVDEYIRVLRTLGINQLNIYGRYRAYRHGDFEVNPELYPRGRASLKAVIDRLHAADIMAGFHSLSFAIAGNSRWITPTPDARLAKDGVYHLAGAISDAATTVPVMESLEHINPSPTARDDNSLTLQIDRELIEFQAIKRDGGWAFTGCRRGAWGTIARSHPADVPVCRLSKVWGNYVPDGHSTLLPEIAAAAADLVNECGFDMAYFDGLDGEDRLGDPALGWHYGARFVYEFCRRLQRPLLLEMATFHHHLWVVRSRIGAWDYPTKNYQRFVDHHVAANRQGERIMLPAQLGWWSSEIDSRWAGIQGERMFPEDVEYWCGKALATGAGIALVGPEMNPDRFFAGRANQAAAQIIRDYETARHAGTVTPATRAELARPGAEFKLVRQADGRVEFRRRHRAQYLVTAPACLSAAIRQAAITVAQPAGSDAVMLRLEPLFSIMPYDDAAGITLADFEDAHEFGAPDCALDYAAGLRIEKTGDATHPRVGCFKAEHSRRATFQAGPANAPEAHGMRALPTPKPVWAVASKTFAPPLNLCRPETIGADAQSDWAALSQHGQSEAGDRLGLGVWVEGDGSGAVLNVQLLSPRHVRGVADHYIVLDFTGWRYVELVEPESARLDDYGWPYSENLYCLFRERVDFKQIESLNLWLNNVPDGGAASVRLGPIRALPLVPVVMRQPTLRIGRNTVQIPMDIGTGDYLELDRTGTCRRFDVRGEMVETAMVTLKTLDLRPGNNSVEISTGVAPAGLTVRMRLTVSFECD